jgi:hypothetical protein
MPVTSHQGFALIVRWNRRTESLIERYIANLTEPSSLRPVDVDLRGCNWDQGGLFALPVSPRNVSLLHDAAQEFELEGALRGTDFAVLAADGSLDPLPGWLVQGLTPTGNPAELEAKMEPEVYEMWQRTRLCQYELKPTKTEMRNDGSPAPAIGRSDDL